MTHMTSCKFDVSDGEGAPTRPFKFDTIQQGDQYTVTITQDGIGPYGVTLTKQDPTKDVPKHDDARVKVTGSLKLLFDSKTDPNVAIAFSGALVTAHPTWMTNVIIAVFD
jgi:hypothetical protein